MRAIISALGKEWSRSLEAWRWGCRVTSKEGESACVIDWNRDEKQDKYLWDLEVIFGGEENRKLETLIRDRIKKVLRHPSYVNEEGFDKTWPEPRLREERGREQLDLGEEVIGPRDLRVGVRVGISFASEDANHPGIDRVPKRVSELLTEARDKGKVAVLPSEIISVALDDNRHSEELAKFMGELASSDIVVVFWSKKFWKSKYCMYEMMTLYEAEPRGRFPLGQVLAYIIDGGKLVRTGDRKEGDTKTTTQTEWEYHWAKEYEEAFERTAEELERISGTPPTKIQIQEEVQKGIAGTWLFFFSGKDQRDQLATLLIEYRQRKNVALPKCDDECEKRANEVVNDICELLVKPDRLLELAVKRWKDGVDRKDERMKEEAAFFVERFLCVRPDRGESFTAWLDGEAKDVLPANLIERVRERLGGR